MPSPADLENLFARRDAEERIRQRQQGHGKPIIGVKFQGHQVVGVGKTLYFSNDWKTFPDFLAHYIKQKLDPDWGNAEIAKPWAERHPLLQWYDAFCKYQQKVIRTPGEVTVSEVVGVVSCYLGTAYALYLLDHNVELQTRLINRLKDPGQFQGAYYELIVASVLIRAGFDLALEDETDGATKHCEFAAVSKKTGKRYWVEAKMRSVTGLLGRTEADGGPDGKPLKQLIPHLNKALAKPANDERLIFIDVNTPPVFLDGRVPDWMEPAVARLEAYEKNELPEGMTAYLFVTNVSAHRQLLEKPTSAGVPFGLGMADFNRPGYRRVSEAYRQKLKHIDAFDIGEAFDKLDVFPTTFDGTLPSEAFGRETARVVIGQTYEFDDGIIGRVTAATVDEQSKEMTIAVRTQDGQNALLRHAMTDQDLAEYREVPDAYFGRITPKMKHTKDAYDLFEWLMEANQRMSREKMLNWFNKDRADRAELEAMNDLDLRIAYCEAMAAAVVHRHGFVPTDPREKRPG